jgi:hypothetical protein
MLLLLLCTLFMVGCHHCADRDANHPVETCKTCKKRPGDARLAKICTTCKLEDGHKGKHQCSHGHFW